MVRSLVIGLALVGAVRYPATAAKPLEYLENPPPVQFFVPGFTVRELPVELPNINNVLYRADGKLVALAYNGDVYLLSDTNGDGLEDHAALYWENAGQITAPIGMDLTPPGYDRGPGVFISSKMKCLLLVDTNADDTADQLITVAEGWQESFQNVDALGVAIDPRDGSVYFGIGTQNFADPYLIDETGQARFRIDGDRGTIQRVSPDFQSRHTVATGIRFPVAIRFNRRGDLFCTDQEGATWLPNGNPLDELLHIDTGRVRHYGFPPRHPQHLPEVIDEPSLFDYAPQHQSTCGLNFNDPVADGPTFGPSWWEGDAIVTGYARGKLYRTKLASTPAGYVAQNQLIASLSALAVDACVSPDGALVIATHSGGPDWGSGPSGMGRLFKVSYTDRQAPIPVKAWARTPHEIRVAFDRPLEPQQIAALSDQVSIDAGLFVAAGDRFEVLRPGYAVVERQVNTPRYDVPVAGISHTADRRTLILSTAPHAAAMSYALTLSDEAPQVPTADENVLPQIAEIDLAYDLTGVEANWQPASPELPWHGWIPHLDLAAAEPLTAFSADHDALWRQMRSAGTLILRTQLRLQQMLRPEVQLGSEIDYEYPPETTTIVLESNCRIEVSVDGELIPVVRRSAAEAAPPGDDQWTAEFSRPSSNAEVLVALEVRLVRAPSARRATLAVSYHTNEDRTPRALPLHRMLMPWAAVADEPQLAVDNRDVPELQGGNWLRGKEIFFGKEAMCSQCHQMRGQGGRIGPDLSNLPQRDYASVLRDITQPSYTINPDYVTYTIVTTSGRVLTGSIRSHGEHLYVGGQDGSETLLAPDDVEEFHPSSVSIMPDGIDKQLGPERLRDLLTFLLLEPPTTSD